MLESKSMRRLLVILGVSLTFFSMNATARPLKGFYEGPYLALSAGAIQAENDKDDQAQTNVGRAIEPAGGLIFGWNVWDVFALELKGEYATNDNGGRREHLLNIALQPKYTFLIDRLVDFPTLRILPFLSMGGASRFAVLPGNILSSDQKVTSVGIGPTAGGGIAFLWKKYFFFGVDVREDFLFYDDVRQTLDLAAPPATDQIIYRGGFHPSFAAIVFVGVHY